MHLSPLQSYQVVQGQLGNCKQLCKTEDGGIMCCGAGYALGNDKTCVSVGTKPEHL